MGTASHRLGHPCLIQALHPTCMLVSAMLSADSLRMLRALQRKAEEEQAAGVECKQAGEARSMDSRREQCCHGVHGKPFTHLTRNWMKVATMGWPRSARRAQGAGRPCM